MHVLRFILSLALLVVLNSPALAAPTLLSQQGRLLDGDAEPLDGSHELTFSLYTEATGGVAIWTEASPVAFEEGYYAVTLGETTPLDDLLFAHAEVWLEMSVGGDILSPRQAVVSVPYALRATAAEHVEGGVVNAEDISIGGNLVIDSDGNWVGPTPAIAWGDLSDVPADIADGDQDEDTLASLACAQDQAPKWDAASNLWICGDDIDTDTLAGLPCADGSVAKFDAGAALWGCAADADSFADLAGTCLAGDIPVLDPVSGGWICGTDQNTVTSSLPWSGITGIPADLADGDQDTITTTLAWSAITGIPADLADGDQDTDTVLTEAQVDAYADNNGYSTGAHTLNTDTNLTPPQVRSALVGQDIDAASLSVTAGVSALNGKVRRDFLTWSTTASSPNTIHIKTNIPVQSNVMYRFLVEGYNYQEGTSINSDAVGYTFNGWACTGHTSENNYASGVSLSQYCSSDGFVVLRLTLQNTYYIGFSVSGWFTNPTGFAWDISATVFHQTADL